MTANRELAKQRGLREEDIDYIDILHGMADYVMKMGADGNYTDTFVEKYLRQIEFELQSCWKFEQNETYHTYYKNYLSKKQWVNRKFKCIKTGEVLEIPWEVKETDCFFWGDGCMIDVGRAGFYSRASGDFLEIREEKE